MMPAMITLYGITNCDTVKKARAWLQEQGLDYVFHDFKKQGLSEARLDAWMAALGWERLLNRKGTSWRQLDAAEQAGVHDAASAKALILGKLSLIKRPVVEWDGQAQAGMSASVQPALTVGFNAEEWSRRNGA